MVNNNIEVVNVRGAYDLCILGFYAVGGVATYLYQLWNYLNNNNVRSLLIMNFSQLRISPDQDAINIEHTDFSLIDNLLSILTRIHLRNVYIAQIYSIPYFLPLIKKYPTFLHIEYWPHELPLAISKLKESYPIFEKEFVQKGEQIEDHWAGLMKHTKYFDKRWYDTDYLLCYWLSLLYSNHIGLWIGKDLKRWRNLCAETIVGDEKLIYLPPMVDTEMFKAHHRKYDNLAILVNGKKTHQENFVQTFKIVQKSLSNQLNYRILITGLDHLPRNIKHVKRDRIKYLGSVPYDKVSNNYKQGHIYTLLSKSHEGFSVSVLEAMASGCVPIVSDFISSNMGNVIKDGYTGFITANVQNLEALLEMLAGHHKKLVEIGKNARKVIEKSHSFERLKKYPFFRDLFSYACALRS